MKKLSALLLALLLAATLCFSAMAEEVNYTGVWELTLMSSGETSFDPAMLGLVMTLELNEDGTCTITTADTSESGTWAPTETGVELTDATETLALVYADGSLSMELDGAQMVFTPVAESEYASILSNLTVADFAGTWEMEHVESTYGWYDVEELGTAMTVVITGADAAITMTTDEGTESYTAVLETEEAAELGTILWASFLDPTTGEPDGTGMLFLLYDDGQLVWYEYDSEAEAEFYYCFNRVEETAE